MILFFLICRTKWRPQCGSCHLPNYDFDHEVCFLRLSSRWYLLCNSPGQDAPARPPNSQHSHSLSPRPRCRRHRNPTKIVVSRGSHDRRAAICMRIKFQLQVQLEKDRANPTPWMLPLKKEKILILGCNAAHRRAPTPSRPNANAN